MANKILVARGTKARIEEIKSSLSTNELVYSTDTGELGVKKADGNIEYFMNATDINAKVDPNAMAYFDYAGSIYGDKYSLLPNAWEHSLTVDPLEISEDSSFSNQRGTAQYPNGEIEGVIIPHGVTTIGELAFANWKSNNQPLVIPDSVTSIGSYAFFTWQSNTQPLVIPNSVTSIEESAFANWKSNNQPLVIPDSVTGIGSYAFQGWNSNNHPLVIPDSVTSIGSEAFQYWSLVPHVEIQATTPPTLASSNAFDGQNDAPIYVPDESVETYKTATNWVSLADRIFPISDKVVVMGDILALETANMIKSITRSGSNLFTITYYDDTTSSLLTLAELKTFIGEATQSLSGLMSAQDKVDLDTLMTLFDEDGDSVVNTIAEILAIFENYPEGADLVTALAGKVDKVSGKGLSTNDFTNNDKNKLDGIEAGAEVNPYSKTQLDNMFDDKVDKVSGMGLSSNDFTTTEKNKLSGIQAGAQVNAVTTVAGRTGAVVLAKADVGLGSVQNYAIASKTQAEAGTSNGHYMTPLRTKEAITANARSNTWTPTWSQVSGKPTFAPSNAQKNSDITKAEIEAKLTGQITSHSHALPTHTHDDRYYTETEIDTKLVGKADATHTHTKSQISDFAHNHDDRYYTEGEMDTLLNAKLNSSLKGSANGLAELGADGKVPSSQLPSYVDDVLEYTSFSNFPPTGESSKIYISQDTNKTYRWGGSGYIEISASLALGETSSTAGRGDWTKTAYDHTLLTNNPHGVTKAQVGLGNVDNTSDLNKPISTATQSALDDKVDKVTGKGLSTNDFTNNDKNKLDGIEAGAEVNPYSKTQLDNMFDDKVDKVSGMGLSSNDFTTTEKSKLAGIASGAEVNVQSDWNATSGDAQILNKPTLATVATSGSYADLSNKPTIPDTSGLLPKSGGTLENYNEKLTTLSTSGGAINLSLGNVFVQTPSANITYAINNAVSGVAHSFTLIIHMGSTVRTLTFPASVKWQGGEIPDMTTPSKTYVLTFMTVDGGTNWLGMFGGEF